MTGFLKDLQLPDDPIQAAAVTAQQEQVEAYLTKTRECAHAFEPHDHPRLHTATEDVEIEVCATCGVQRHIRTTHKPAAISHG